MNFDRIALRVPTILLPAAGVDMTRWAVIACDQYTSDPDYWEKVREAIDGAPSTLELIFPEIFLEEEGRDERIARINAAMDRYLAEGILQPLPPGFVLVDRQTAHAPSRKGLMVALDLEAYDYGAASTSLIRATEGTILDRLPPRIRVREKASLELPHIMVLIDDPERTVIEPLFAQTRPAAYDFPLMLGGGHLRGWRVEDEASIAGVVSALAALAEPAAFRRKYALQDQAPVLYAMGDGNHSFATAKAIWEKLKKEAPDPAAIMDHPARWALVELVNVHDPGLEFEPIHRVVFGVDFSKLARMMTGFFAAAGSSCRILEVANRAALDAALQAEKGETRHLLPLVAEGHFALAVIENPTLQLTVATLQPFLDAYLAETPGARIDYIHGEGSVTALGSRPGNVGFYLPALSKHELFKTIILDGALPRKTFSMGEADEKRFYLECRRIGR